MSKKTTAASGDRIEQQAAQLKEVGYENPPTEDDRIAASEEAIAASAASKPAKK